MFFPRGLLNIMMVILTQNETLMQFQHYRIHIALAAVAVVRAAADGRLLTKYEQFCATVYIAMVKFWKRNNNMFTGAYSTKWRNSCTGINDLHKG
jgi:hypothetical protein